MSNPARELADMLNEWRTVPAQRSVYTTRGGGQPGDLSFWRSQLHAVDLLKEVSNILRAAASSGRRMSHYERAETAWCRGVFAPDAAWNAPSNGDTMVIAETSIDILYSLADYIDATGGDLSVDAEGQRGISAALEEIKSLLADDQHHLGTAEKRYVFELIMSISGVLGESDTFGSVDLLRRLHELFGYLTRLAEDLESDPATADLGRKIRGAARKVLPYVRFSTGFVAGAIGAVADIQQITGGAS